MLQYPLELVKLTDEIDTLQRDVHGVAHSEPPQGHLQQIHLMKGQPWLQLHPFDLPKDDVAAFFTKLRSLFIKYQLFDFLKKLEFEQILPSITPYIKGDLAAVKSNAAALGINPASYQFFLQELLRPSFRSWAAFFSDHLDQDKWRLNICPVCGHLPAGGRQETNEGRRFLICSQCETEWLFNRVTCPRCYNDEHSTLGYFTVEGVGDWKVGFCSKCNSYIKEVITDEPVGAFDLELAVQLDLLAEREGFYPIDNQD